MKLSNTSILLLSGAGLWLMSSCASESPFETGGTAKDGKIELNLVADAGVSVGTRAESDDNYAISPDKSLFSVSLLSSDGSIDKTWESVAQFNKEEGFPMGNYTISARYGELETEGFENPYYYGEENIEVTLGHTTVQTITATLANSMLSVRYSDDITSFFKQYSAAVQTDGNPTLAYAQTEERAAYLKPGEAKFFVTLTNDKDETVTVNLTTLKLSPRHHYIVTVGVSKDNLGNNTLDVEVTEDIFVEEPIKITLTDEFFAAPVPTITAVGFDPSTSYDFFEAFADNVDDPQIHVMALAGLKSAQLKLTAEGANKLPVWNSNSETLELIDATDDLRSKLTEANIDCKGFFENAADFAFIDFADYIKNLVPGSYTASLSVTDKLGRTVDVNLPAVVLKANVEEVKYEISGYKTPDFLSSEIILAVSTNCDKLRDAFSFQANNEDGDIVAVTPENINNEGFENITVSYPHTFYYKLPVGLINDNQWTVIVNYAAKELKQVIDVNLPEFGVETDAYAKRVKIRIDAEDETLTEQLAKIVNIKDNGVLVKSENIDRSNADKGIIIIKGLNARNATVDGEVFDGNYAMTLYLGKKTDRADYSGTPFNFTTEEALEVPNGNFEEKDAAFNVSKINVGGLFNVTFLKSVDYQIVSSINLKEPQEWGTLNGLTCYKPSGTPNTWFYVPSTFTSNGECTIRTVGYSHGSPTIEKSSGRYMTASTYACMNAPDESELEKVAGEIFLGNYDQAGNKKNSGISFDSRPSGLKLNYSYMGINNNDNGLVKIKIKDNTGNVIAESEDYKITATQDWDQTLTTISSPTKEIIVNIPDAEFAKKASLIEVCIKSSYKEVPEIYLPTGSELLEGLNSLGSGGITSTLVEESISANAYHAYSRGSILKVSNLEFVYE